VAASSRGVGDLREILHVHLVALRQIVELEENVAVNRVGNRDPSHWLRHVRKDSAIGPADTSGSHRTVPEHKMGMMPSLFMFVGAHPRRDVAISPGHPRCHVILAVGKPGV
jgi:hypothetical protein